MPLISKIDLEQAVTELRKIDSTAIDLAFQDIPKQWEVNAETQSAMKDFLLRRADKEINSFKKGIVN